MTIHITDLDPETIKRLKLPKPSPRMVAQRVVVLGKLLQAIEGLSTRDALWALRSAYAYARGYRKIKTRVIS